MAKSITSEKIQLTNVRLSFPTLDKASAYKEGQEPSFAASFLLDPSNKEHAVQIAKIKSEAARIAKAFFTDGVPKSFSNPGCKELCFGKGDDLEKVYDGYEGMFWIKGKSYSRVPIVGRRKNDSGKFSPVAPGDKEWPYAGCYVNATITLWTQNSHGRKAINGNLVAIQFVKDGEAFGGGRTANPDEEFQALEDGEGSSPFEDAADPFAA